MRGGGDSMLLWVVWGGCDTQSWLHHAIYSFNPAAPRKPPFSRLRISYLPIPQQHNTPIPSRHPIHILPAKNPSTRSSKKKNYIRDSQPPPPPLKTPFSRRALHTYNPTLYINLPPSFNQETNSTRDGSVTKTPPYLLLAMLPKYTVWRMFTVLFWFLWLVVVVFMLCYNVLWVLGGGGVGIVSMDSCKYCVRGRGRGRV